MAGLPIINPSISVRGITESEANSFYADFSFESGGITLEAAEKEAMQQVVMAIATTGVALVDKPWITETYDNDRGVWLSEY